MKRVVAQLKTLVAPGGVIVLVIGDVAQPGKNQLSLARVLIQTLQHTNEFAYIGVLDDYIGHDIKTTRIWGETKGRATDVDRFILLSDRAPTLRIAQLAAALGDDAGATDASFRQLDVERLAENVRVLTQATA